MEYVKLGRTGLEVARICLGCMSYGVPDRGPHPWTLNVEESRPFIRKALELGINSLIRRTCTLMGQARKLSDEL